MIRLTARQTVFEPSDQRSPTMPNTMRGEFDATIGGERHAFDTTLGTIAQIEQACGGRSIMEIVGAVVMGRKASDQIPLLAAALQATGQDGDAAQALAAQATVPEAEAFILALMGALGFKLARGGEAGEASPLDGSSAGSAGGSSRSAA